jgi:predicted dinucleotide-binding enzyme
MIRTVGVIGAGTMGNGIAQVFAQASSWLHFCLDGLSVKPLSLAGILTACLCRSSAGGKHSYAFEYTLA